MNAKKKIPWYIDGCIAKISDSNVYFGINGEKYRMDAKPPVPADFKKIKENTECSDYYYFDIEPMGDTADAGKCLTLNRIAAEDGKMYGIETVAVSYNEKYNELDGMDKIPCLDNDMLILDGKTAVRVFMQEVLAKQEWYDGYAEKGFPNVTADNIYPFIDFFRNNAHKHMMPLLLEYADNACISEYINLMLKGSIDYSCIETAVFRRAVEFSVAHCVDVGTSLAIFQKYKNSLTAVENFCRLLEFFGHNCNDAFISICGADITDFPKFADYIVRQCLTANEAPIEDKDNNERTLRKYVKLYADYVNALEICGYEAGTADLYPENLYAAHDAAVGESRMFDGRKTYDVAKFKAETMKYRPYEWTCMYASHEYGIEIPKHPNDMIINANKLNNCVNTYINSVIRGSTCICFVKKDGEIYAAVEVIKGRVIQALASCNKRLNETDKAIVRKWAKDRGLVISCF